jgi:predicted transcriptional regulator
MSIRGIKMKRKGKAATLAIPSRTDLEILSILWDKGQATAREIHNALTEKGAIRSDVAYTTVRTYLDRLIYKGYATAEDLSNKRGTYVYRAVISQKDVREHPGVLDRIVTALGMRPPEFALWFYQKGKLSRKDREELEKILHDIQDDKLLPEEKV